MEITKIILFYSNCLFFSFSGNAVISYLFIDTFTKCPLSFLTTHNSVEIAQNNNNKLRFLKYRSILYCKGFIFLLCDVLKCYYGAEEFFQILSVDNKCGWWQRSRRVLYKESSEDSGRQQVGSSTTAVLTRRQQLFALCFSCICQVELNAS